MFAASILTLKMALTNEHIKQRLTEKFGEQVNGFRRTIWYAHF